MSAMASVKDDNSKADQSGVSQQPAVSFGLAEPYLAGGAMQDMVLRHPMAKDVTVRTRVTPTWDLGPAKQPHPGFLSGLGDVWDNITDNVRSVTPAFVINNGSRFNFGFRAAADVASMVSGQKFDSPYRTAASAISLAGLSLGLFFKEEPPTEERKERIKQMPLGEYIAMRVKDSFDPKHHVMATVGMATIPNGVLMAISGYQKRIPGHAPWELYQGLMTVAAGMSLNFIPDQERAWQTATAIFTIRAPFAAKQAHTAYYYGQAKPDLGFEPRSPKEFPGDWKTPPGDYMQALKFVFNQTSNLFGFFYGGIHKDEQGNIIRLKDIEAKKNEDARKAEGLSSDLPPMAAGRSPDTYISDVNMVAPLQPAIELPQQRLA